MRTILSVESYGDTSPEGDAEHLVIRALRSPFNIPKAAVARSFNLQPSHMPDWGIPGAVRQRGELLRAQLATHPGIAQLLNTLETTPVDEFKPIYIVLSDSDAELISWETLCDTHGAFVALDKRWPIGRITDPMSGQPRPPAELQRPVRVMLVISAFGIADQHREWEVFVDALEKGRAAGLDILVKVLVGAPEIRQRIEQRITDGLAGVEVGHIQKTSARLIGDILEWSPNILHFFCHGRANESDQSLILATGSDYADPETVEGSTRVMKDSLVTLSTSLPNPWLLILNCCSTGQPVKNLQSIAHGVVSAGFPAAVAMLEPIDANDAFEFTDAFYHSLFPTLQNAVVELREENRTAFEWSSPMFAARAAIRDLHGEAQNYHEWSLPVLYVRGLEPFFFERPRVPAVSPGDTSTYRAKAQVVAEWIRSVGTRYTPAEIEAIIAHALSDVPREFWPSPKGDFGNG